MSRFTIVWAGQFISLCGSGLTRFALGVWVYERTRDVALFSMLLIAAALPGVVVSPFAGALIDRYTKRRALLVGETIAALAPLGVMLACGDEPHPGIIGGAMTIASAASAFQEPALAALTTELVPSSGLNRANGMVQFAHAACQVISPLAAAALLSRFGMRTILIVDVVTFAVALATLVSIRPRQASPPLPIANRCLLHEVASGFRYMKTRPQLVMLLGLLAGVNLFSSLGHAIFTPLVLEITTTERLGVIMGIGGIGMLAGSAFVTAWPGPRRPIRAILGAVALLGGGMVVAGLSPSTSVIATSTFAMFFAVPLLTAYDLGVWQAQCSARLQGRLFAIRNMTISGVAPLGLAAGGFLGESMLRRLNHSEAQGAGRMLVGRPGRGLGLLLAAAGAAVLAFGFMALRSRALGGAEDEAARGSDAGSSSQPPNTAC